jgi:hypothetical protein
MKRLFLVLCLLPILIASSENEEFKSIMAEIKRDISYSKSELKKLKPLFQEEYETIGKPGIKQLRFSDLTIHERMTGWDDQEVMIISTNSARVMGNWDYTKPHIYLIEKNKWGWKISLKQEIESTYTAMFGSCRTNNIGLFLCTDNAFQFFKPKDYGRNQPYVFQGFNLGGSGSNWTVNVIEYNKYSREYQLRSLGLSFPILPNPPTD